MSDAFKRTATELAAANDLTVTQLGLRFDKVVVRVLGSLDVFARNSVPAGSVLIVTITAPLREASKTTREIESKIADSIARKSRNRVKTLTIYENQVSFLVLKSTVKRRKKFIGFVHNPTTDARKLLGLGRDWFAG